MMTSKNLWLGMALEGGSQAAASAHERARVALGRGSGPARQADRRPQPLRPRPQVHDQARHPDPRRAAQIHTGDELLECKNFGVTSLNEVREKLRELNLKLKNE